MLVYETYNSSNPLQFPEMEMILPYVIWRQPYRPNDCSPIQWVDNDMILASVIWSQQSTFNDCSPIQWVDIDMMLASVIWSQQSTFNDCSPIQWVDIDMMLSSVIWSQQSTFNDCSPIQGYYCSSVTAHYNEFLIWCKANVILRVCEEPHSPTQNTELRFFCFPRQEVILLLLIVV